MATNDGVIATFWVNNKNYWSLICGLITPGPSQAGGLSINHDGNVRK